MPVNVTSGLSFFLLLGKIEQFSQLTALNDTHREKASLNNTPMPSKSMNMDIWVVGTLNQFLIFEVLKLKQNFRKNKVVSGKNSDLFDRLILYSPFYLS